MSRGPLPVLSLIDDVVVGFEPPHKSRRFSDVLHHHSLAVFSILLLLVGSSAIIVGSIYWQAHITILESQKTTVVVPNKPLQGPNIIVKRSDLSQSVKQISEQPFKLSIGDNSATISPEVIKSWLQIVTDRSRGVSYIHVNQAGIKTSLQKAAEPYIHTPLNQVSINHGDGSSFVISKGINGTQLGDTTEAVKAIGNNLLTAKGLTINLPVTTQPFATSTAADFDKLIEVDVVTKQMYLYQKGELYKQYPISAGAPITPTPIGQFKIYEKLPLQDMRGFNANGTRYFQPNVRWINYFKQGGYAIHGNYWRPTSWFGNINSSHGCVSLPEIQAKEVYDWAPIGTTVITHY